MTKPLVAIVGRPNVGKSTLFNRIVGQRLAIVEDVPGTTRDRLYADAEWNGRAFTVIDTGGLGIAPGEALLARVQEQAKQAIAEADVIILLVDVIEGLTPDDEEVADILRRSAKPLFLAANKVDSAKRRLEAVEFYRLGLGEPLPISALHGHGVGDLLDAVVASFPTEAIETPSEAVSIAIVGRPNVGKSSLLNAILGQERAIVHEAPGTTRDAIDTTLDWHGQPVVLIDTAGIRRRGRIEPGVEQYGVLRALRAIQRADVVLLLIDASEGVAAQDTHIAGYIVEAGKSLVLVVNKWDLVPKERGTVETYTAHIREAFKFVLYAPILFISAKMGLRVKQVVDTALRIRAERRQRISTGELNRLLAEAVAEHAPPSKTGKRLKFYYATQAEVEPPTFVLFVNDKRLVHFSYQRFLENKLREQFGFEGTPIRLTFRGKG